MRVFTSPGLDYLNEPRHPSEGAEPVGIQHRDVKPQNLLLVGGSVKIADFGLARILEHTQTSHTGSMTPAYAAPEFFKKQTSSQSDQYSLAVAYCHLRGGRLPFTGGMAEVIAGHLLEPPDLTMLPEGEREVAARALAKEPKDRWDSCRAFVEALRSGVPAQDGITPMAGPTCGTFRTGEVISSSTGGSASPDRPVPNWGAQREVRSRRSATAMSNRGRKILALSLTALFLSLMIAVGLWIIFTPRSKQGRPHADDHQIASSSDTKPGDSITSTTPEPNHPVATESKPANVPERAPALSLSVPASLSLGLGDKKTLTLKVSRDGFAGPVAVRFKGIPGGVAIEPTTIPCGATDTEVEVNARLHASIGTSEVTVIGSNGPVQTEVLLKMTITDSAVSHWTKGKALLDDHKEDQAIVEFGEALRLDPNYPIAYANRGLAFKQKGDLDRAIADYDEAIRLDPKCEMDRAEQEARARARDQATGLVAFYTFDDGTARDVSGNGNNGTLSPDPPNFIASGYQGRAFSYESARNNFITIPVNINPVVMPQITMGGWFNASATTDVIRGLISHDDGRYDRTLDIDFRGSSDHFTWSAFTGSGVIGGSPVAPNRWTFVAMRQDQNTGRLVLDVDGEHFTATRVFFGSGLDTTTIGRNPSFDIPFYGRIDNVFIFSSVLSDAQISDIRANGAKSSLFKGRPYIRRKGVHGVRPSS